MNPISFVKRQMSSLAFALIVGMGTGWTGSFSRDARGTSAATFLKLPVSARSAGLGGAVTALEGEAASLAWNPAGLAALSGRKVLLNHAPYLDETAYSNGIYAQAWKGGGLAVGISYFDAGSIDQTESGSGNVVGTFHPADWAGSVGYGRRFAGWSVGLAGKYVTTRVVESDGTPAADVGILSPGLWAERVRLGVAAKNLGGRLTLGTTSRPLPVEYSLGVAARPLSSWLVTGDLKFPRDDDPSLAFGTEGTWSPLKGWTLAARAGWSGTTDKGLGGFSGTTVGLGVGFSNLTVDYAFSPVSDLGDAHRVSLGFSF